MKSRQQVDGHFKSLFQHGDSTSLTTITSQLKNHSRRQDAMKTEQLLKEISALTGKPASRIGRPIDGVVRRWSGVKSHRSE